MSYAESLAKDRDKYLRQRNALARTLRDMLAPCENGTWPTHATMATARKQLAEIDNAPEPFGGLK